MFTFVLPMMRVIGKVEKRGKRVHDGSRGAQIAIWGLRPQATDPKEDNRQTVRRGAEQGTPLNLGLGILERRAS